MPGMDWFWWAGTITSGLLVAAVLGFVRWWRRPRGVMEIAQTDGWPCRVSVAWVGAGEAWDVMLLPVHGMARGERFRATRMVDGSERLWLLMTPDEQGRASVQVMWRPRQRARRGEGKRLDVVARHWVRLRHRDLKRPLPE